MFAAAGARLALVDVDEAAVRERASALDALGLAGDLGSMTAAAEMVAAVRRRYGRVDALIHTAGAFAMAPAHAFSDELFDQMLTVNLRTLCAATCAVLPGFVDQGRGFVAGFSSGVVWEGRGGEGMSVYAAAKAGVASFLHAVEAEYRTRGVSAAVVYPLGAVDTPANRRSMPDADPAGLIDPRGDRPRPALRGHPRPAGEGRRVGDRCRRLTPTARSVGAVFGCRRLLDGNLYCTANGLNGATAASPVA